MFEPLTDDDKGFIRAILDHPEELTTWLAYADWLDDRGDPRSEYLRLIAERRILVNPDRIAEIDARLALLSGILDPDWMLIFDRGRLAYCGGRVWGYSCPRTWDKLYPSDNPAIRICHSCHSPVFFCHTLEEARQYVECGQCVAISSRIVDPDTTEDLLRLLDVEPEAEFDDDDLRDADTLGE